MGSRSGRPHDHGRERVPRRSSRLDGAGAGRRDVLGGAERQQQLAAHLAPDAEPVGHGRRCRLEVPVLARRGRHLRRRAGDGGAFGDGDGVALAGGEHDCALPRRRQLGQLLPRRDHEHDAEPAGGSGRNRGAVDEHHGSQRRRSAADRHGREPGDGDDRDHRHPRSALPDRQRDADRSAGQRTCGGRCRCGDGALQHDRAADRHERTPRDVGDAGDDTAADLRDRGSARGAPGRHAAPAREHDRPRRRRAAPARPGRERGDRDDREHRHADAPCAGRERRADRPGDEDAPLRLGRVPARDRRTA